MILCAAFAAGLALSITPAMAASKGPCHAWVRAYHDAKKRGDHTRATIAQFYWYQCLDAAKKPGARFDKPTHKQFKGHTKKKSH
jgi:hypothetical protein